MARAGRAGDKGATVEPARGGAAGLALAVSPGGHFHLAAPSEPEDVVLPARIAGRIEAAFARSSAAGLIHLAATELETSLPASLAFGRELGRRFLSGLCHVADLEGERERLRVPAPSDELAALAARAPPLRGAEYLSVEALAAAWRSLEAEVAAELCAFEGSAADYLRAKGPAWNVMGRVCFHLAENRGSDQAPFAFLATYAARLSAAGRVQHAPLARAIDEYAGAAKKQELLRLLEPVRRAAERSALVRELLETRALFHPLAWSPSEAHAFLKDVGALEESGIVVRVPDWWHARRPSRPQVSVTVGRGAPAGLGAEALLDFAVEVSLDGEPLSRAEWEQLLAGADGLQLLKGRWVEVDHERLREVLDHWKRLERQAGEDGVSLIEGMRLLSGVRAPRDDETQAPADAHAWSEVKAGAWLEQTLANLRNPRARSEADPGDELHGTLRPYQRDGVAWLWLLSRLGLGACLADDMGLGKTVQVLALLVLLRRHGEAGPHLLVVPASLH